MQIIGSQKTQRSVYIPILIVVALLLMLPLVVNEEYVIYVFTTAFVAAIYAMSWNLLSSSGQVSLGHAGFFGIGAYASVLLTSRLYITPWLTILIGPLFAALIGLGVGLLCVRLKEWFLAMVTFGFALIVESLVVDQLAWLTNGWDGLPVPSLVPTPSEFKGISLYYLTFGITVVVYLVTRKAFNSKFGLAISAIRDNQLVANASGINLTQYKLIAFVVSAYLAGFAGALEAHTVGRFISPEIFKSINSFWPLVYSVSGGVGTPEGPIIGAMLIRLSWEGLRNLGGYASMIIIGTILVVEVIFLPHGLFPLLKKIAGSR